MNSTVQQLSESFKRITKVRGKKNVKNCTKISFFASLGTPRTTTKKSNDMKLKRKKEEGSFA